MYIRFEQGPKDDQGNPKLVVNKGKLLQGRAIIIGAMPAMPYQDLLNFGIWKDSAGTLSVTMPAANNGFEVVAPRSIMSTIKDEDGHETVEARPSIAGKQEAERVRASILAAWNLEPAFRFKKKFDFTVPGEPGKVPVEPTVAPSQPSPVVKPTK